MKNITSFREFVNEGIGRYPVETKSERTANQKKHFIERLIKLGFNKNQLEDMSIGELGKKLDSAKKHK